MPFGRGTSGIVEDDAGTLFVMLATAMRRSSLCADSEAGSGVDGSGGAPDRSARERRTPRNLELRRLLVQVVLRAARVGTPSGDSTWQVSLKTFGV